MNKYVLLGLVVLCVVTGFVSYWRGYEHGKLAVHAQVASLGMKQLNAVVIKNRQQLAAANATALHQRQQAADREARNEKATNALRTALAAAKSRSCLAWRLPAGIVQQLAAARDSAAHAAASGLDGPMPGAAPSH